mgnify:CR=1 FL=1
MGNNGDPSPVSQNCISLKKGGEPSSDKFWHLNSSILSKENHDQVIGLNPNLAIRLVQTLFAAVWFLKSYPQYEK